MKKHNFHIALFILFFLMLNSTAIASTESAEKSTPMTKEDYQKKAQEYKEPYEKYQKLANQENTAETKTDSKDKETPPPVEKSTTKEKSAPAKKDDWKTDSSYIKVEKPWDGTNIGFGGSIATGDSATRNFNTLSNIRYHPIKRWNNNLFFNYIYSRDDNASKDKRIKINKSQIRADTSWDFTKYNGAYGRATYLNDELSSYDYIMTESIGYKRRLYDTDTMDLDVTLGPSFLQNQITETREKANDFGFQSTINYIWNFADKSSFKQNFLYNYDPRNKFIYQSITALSTKLYDNLSLQLTFQLDGTTLVTPDHKQRINTITSTNIVYNL